MATTGVSDIKSVLSTVFQPKISRVWNETAVTLSALDKTPGFGANLNQAIQFGNNDVKCLAEGADISTIGAGNTEKKMILDWSHFYASFGLTLPSISVASTSTGSAEALMDLVRERMVNKIAQLGGALNKHVLTGSGADNVDGGRDIHGLWAAFGGADLGKGAIGTAAYAGIDPATSGCSLWKSSLVDHLNANLSVKSIDDLEAEIYTKSGHRPNLILVSPKTWASWKALFEDKRRVIGKDAPYATSTDELYYNSIRIIRDKDLEDGVLLMLNTNFLSMQYLPFAEMPAEAFDFRVGAKVNLITQVGGLDGVRGDAKVGIAGVENGGHQMDMQSLPLLFAPLGRTGDNIKAFFKAQVLLKCTNRAAQGALYNIKLA
jgi:hypothetical protein